MNKKSPHRNFCDKLTFFYKRGKQIQKQVACDFVYSPELLQQAGTVSVEVKNASLDQVLQLCLKDKPLHYKIFGKTVVITPKAQLPAGKPALVNMLIEPVTGVVVDGKGNPIPHATIVLRSLGNVQDGNHIPQGTQSNAKGEFTLPSVTGRMMLIISSVGYATKELIITEQSRNLRIVLTIEETNLDETVVTGYSTKKVRELTGSVQTVSGTNLRTGITTANTLAMLKGKVGGLYIVESGGSSNGSVANREQMIMRGQASLPDAGNTNFGPLIVVDGVITSASNLQDIVVLATALKGNKNTISVGSFAAGIYTMRMFNGARLVTKKFVKK